MVLWLLVSSGRGYFSGDVVAVVFASYPPFISVVVAADVVVVVVVATLAPPVITLAVALALAVVVVASAAHTCIKCCHVCLDKNSTSPSFTSTVENIWRDSFKGDFIRRLAFTQAIRHGDGCFTCHCSLGVITTNRRNFIRFYKLK